METKKIEEIKLHIDNCPLPFSDKIMTDTGDFVIFYSDLEKLMFKTVYSTFINNDYTLLNSPKKILNHFFYNEKRCLDIIKTYPKEMRYFYKKLVFENILNHFTTNQTLSKYAKQIIEKIEKIDVSQYKFRYQFYEKLNSIFGTFSIPKFLISEKINIIKNTEFINSFSKINYDKNKEKTEEELFFVSYLEYLQFKKVIPFDGFKNKEKLFQILLLANYNNIRKSFNYKAVLLFNRDLIYKVFEFKPTLELFNYINQIIDFSEDEINRKKKEYLNIIIEEIEDKERFIFLLASYYYFIIEEIAKDPPQSVICSTLLMSTIEVFSEFYDIFGCNMEAIVALSSNCFIGKRNEMQKKYGYEEFIINFKNSSNKYLLTRFNNLINKLKRNEVDPLIGKFSFFIFNLVTFQIFSPKNSIKLIPFVNQTISDSVTILISGFLSQHSNHAIEWKEYIMNYKPKTNIFFFQWPSESIFTALIKICANNLKIKIEEGPEFFQKAKANAKISGEILALILREIPIFKDKKINLVGFSLGCHVIKYCLEELWKSSNDDNAFINDVTIFGGATTFINEEKWSRVLKEVVKGNFYNCYSTHDNILSFLYQPCIFKKPLGLYPSKIKTIKNVDLSRLKIGHLSYRKKFKVILELLNENKYEKNVLFS